MRPATLLIALLLFFAVRSLMRYRQQLISDGYSPALGELVQEWSHLLLRGDTDTDTDTGSDTYSDGGGEGDGPPDHEVEEYEEDRRGVTHAGERCIDGCPRCEWDLEQRQVARVGRRPLAGTEQTPPRALDQWVSASLSRGARYKSVVAAGAQQFSVSEITVKRAISRVRNARAGR
jgi:hypothetical protein